MTGPRLVDKPLVLYGYGKLGHLAEEVFNKLGIPIDGIFSNYAPLNLMNGKDRLLAICVTTEPYRSIVSSPIFEGWTDIVSVYDIFEAYPGCGVTGGWFVNALHREDIEGCNFVEVNWFDERSYASYRKWVNWRITREEVGWEVTDDRWMIPEVKAVLCGTEPNSTYCELSGSTLADIERRRYEGRIDFERIAFGRPLTNIQLHMEGRELEAIERNMPYFRKHRPIIAVTVYHSRDGLYKIEKALMDGLTNYRFLFRLHAYQGQAAIMYCLPNERSATNGTRKIGS